MGSKERILRLKKETKEKILEAAYLIVKEEGWNGLSMRKIADRIEYTAPIIYEYYSNKEAILKALTVKGFICLDGQLAMVQEKIEDPTEQLETLWMEFWRFAFENKELYQVMFGVEISCCRHGLSEAESPRNRFINAIMKVMEDKNPSEDLVREKYFTFFSVIHGLISVNLVGAGLPSSLNDQILKDAINGIIKSISD
ncbi:TetR/AcrR family transcriptional regulator [Antarcticibacterium sp. 1MA-6-2]|uniref:TetR/AcrR family transcriptional regulator n=1 Tax=Antarcticibacterium sp. 1MA-6-2 TaxID=2908210 RepID=UPI001F44AB62|nr:TetR/AcrR family transcriptional regulator [Antarcticibacterium sp. 1MA-6-2]UJH91950.1 TetR/AcrR family transcriptional regulator [Antarcticibacterium sp. 1MA-6-2]